MQEDKVSGDIINLSQNNMKNNTGKIISIAIVVITVLVGGFLLFVNKSIIGSNGATHAPLSAVQLKFSEKNYKLNYSAITKDFVFSPIHFETNEDWRGVYDFDDNNFREGVSSLTVTSKDNEKTDVYLDKKLDLRKYQVFKISVFLQTDPPDRESTQLYFSDKDKNAYYSYAITNLTKGWNFITIPKVKFSSVNAARINLMDTKTAKSSTVSSQIKTGESQFDWSKIERLGVEVVSRANSLTTVNFDDLIFLENEEYLDDWLVEDPVFLVLTKTAEDMVALEAKHIAVTVALIKKLSGVANFTFKAKLQPIKQNSRSGLFIRGEYKTTYGYYFMIDGVGGNRWQIFKIGIVDNKATNTILKNGIINNFTVEKDKPLYLKVETKDSNMKFSLSMDKKSYTLLGEVNDTEYKEGGIGIAVYDGGITQFDDFEFSQ